MNDSNGYAVFFFPQALEALGDAIKPYLQSDGEAGPHVLCNEIDTGGALVEMTLRGRTEDGRELSLELMVPSGMVRMVVSTHSDGLFGFVRAQDRAAVPALRQVVASSPASPSEAGAVAPVAAPASPAEAAPALPAA